jgi:hypothetical protein
VIVRSAPGLVRQQTADITWLRPTTQNLAKLAVPIPNGFRRVPLTRALLPIVRQIPGGPLQKLTSFCPPGPAARRLRLCFLHKSR